MLTGSQGGSRGWRIELRVMILACKKYMVYYDFLNTALASME